MSAAAQGKSLSKARRWFRRGLKALGVLLGLTAAGLAIWAAIFPQSAHYLVQSAKGQAQLLLKGEPIDELLKQASTSATLKQNFLLVREVKKFAETQLKLKPTRNYEKYLDLKRDYLVMVLTASPPLKMESKTWWFPVVGTVPYKGYFEKELGLADEKELQAQGFETHYRVSPAYSTLGWFQDPLLSTMMLYGEYYLINTVIHESVHATHWVPGEVTFNENMASFIGNQGGLEFYAHKYGKNSKQYQESKRTLDDQALFTKFMNQVALELDELYQKALPDPEKRKVKQQLIAQLKQRYKKELLPKLKSPGYEGFEKREWNNALLMSYRHYNAEQDKLEEIFNQQGRDIPRMMEFLKQKDVMKYFQPDPSAEP